MPEAITESSTRRISLAWIVPLIALGVVLLVIIRAWSERGVTVTVDFPRGHGLETGNAVRLRDIEIGRVSDLRLADDGDVVQAELLIAPEFARFMREGSRFSIQRPQLGFGGVQGLDTLLSARYVQVVTGDGPPRRHFVGLETPVFMSERSPGDLELILQADDRSGMRIGGVVTYRGMPAGRIRSVELSADAAYIEARVVIDARYAPLVREKTRFFATSGLALELSLAGIRAELDSLETMVAGGIGFATPPLAGRQVEAGGRFMLASEPQDDWLAWRPRVAIGEFNVGTITSPPAIRAALKWRSSVFALRRARMGWILPIEDGVLAPRSLLEPPSSAGKPRFEFEGGSVEPGDVNVLADQRGILALNLDLPEDTPRLPLDRIRGPRRGPEGPPEPELLLAWTGSEPIAIAANNLQAFEGGFHIDPALAFARDDLGSPITAAEGGLLVGLLVIEEDGRGKVAFISPPSR